MKKIFLLLVLSAVCLAEPVALNYDQTSSSQGLYNFLYNPRWPGDMLWDGLYDLEWDVSEQTLGFKDNAVLGLGNTAATPDIELKWDGTDLNITAAADATILYLGSRSANFEVRGRLNVESTYVNFDVNPVTAAIAGGAATGTAGDENVLSLPGANFEYHVIGTQTILAPSMGAIGLNISLDETNTDGVEYTQGIVASSKHAYIAQTDAPYLKVYFYITDVNGTSDFLIGWRKAEAYQADQDNYDEMYAVNLINGDVYIDSILNNAATDTNDTLVDITDGSYVTVEVRIAAAGTAACYIDGTEKTSSQNTFTFDSAEVIVPFLYLKHDAGVAEATQLVYWECGKQP